MRAAICVLSHPSYLFSPFRPTPLHCLPTSFALNYCCTNAQTYFYRTNNPPRLLRTDSYRTYSAPRAVTMGDFTLTCNGCRSDLGSSALITRCCHIFCGRCNASKVVVAERQCAICNETLQSENFIVQRALKPSEEERATMLYGLSPTTIMDICWRSLEFWNYQEEQERRYQATNMERLQNNYNQLLHAHQRSVGLANSKMFELRERIKTLLSNEQELRQQADKAREELKRIEPKLLQMQATNERNRHSRHLSVMTARSTDRSSAVDLTGEDRLPQLSRGQHWRPSVGADSGVSLSGYPSPTGTMGGPPYKRYRMETSAIDQVAFPARDDPAYRPTGFSPRSRAQRPVGFERRGNEGEASISGNQLPGQRNAGKRLNASPLFAGGPLERPVVGESRSRAAFGGDYVNERASDAGRGYGMGNRPPGGNGGGGFDYRV
ncbi:hypothetical protein BZA05DRAFT_402658 [Tricharina praecox]|uniref:uncharacterized protein n=1 Tax=Tricharina praecox TaxID=43433 RepID=UPI00221F0BB2|nr:uncharacterized protein BZA05DRAFT_402658 [Tricharina praecox]KAI5849238.1 hypothetical protein BZA05DRAFT_402658 [Tricharina praecox]